MSDPVNPQHYRVGGIELIDVLDDWFQRGSYLPIAVAYIVRHKRKNGVEDLLKAKWYLARAAVKGTVWPSFIPGTEFTAVQVGMAFGLSNYITLALKQILLAGTYPNDAKIYIKNAVELIDKEIEAIRAPEAA